MSDMGDAPAVIRKGRGFKKLDNGHESNLGQLHSDEVGKEFIRSIEGWTIFVTGFHYEAAEEDVLDKFSEFGNVKNLHLNLDRNSGYVKGYALIEYDTYEEAKSAVDGVDNQMYLNKNLKASFAFIKGSEEEETRENKQGSRMLTGGRYDDRERMRNRRRDYNGRNNYRDRDFHRGHKENEISDRDYKDLELSDREVKDRDLSDRDIRSGSESDRGRSYRRQNARRYRRYSPRSRSRSPRR